MSSHSGCSEYTARARLHTPDAGVLMTQDHAASRTLGGSRLIWANLITQDHAACAAAVQNFMLSLAAAGTGSAWTTGVFVDGVSSQRTL